MFLIMFDTPSTFRRRRLHLSFSFLQSCSELALLPKNIFLHQYPTRPEVRLLYFF
ncbi:hypothetical protein C0J52_27515 [Blattella germanica]|nr:hypothetical protein C0J52_27515 [Blattella germanica]